MLRPQSATTYDRRKHTFTVIVKAEVESRDWGSTYRPEKSLVAMYMLDWANMGQAPCKRGILYDGVPHSLTLQAYKGG